MDLLLTVDWKKKFVKSVHYGTTSALVFTPA